MTASSPDPGTVTPLVHIGYHKTATSWLQSVVFREAAVGFARPLKKGQIKDALVLPGSLHFDAAAAKDELYPPLAEAQRRGLIPVVTAERLSGDPSTGGYDGKELADRLAAVFPEGRVLIVIREQRSMIVSAYKNYVKLGGAAAPGRFLSPEPSRLGAPGFDFGHFAYDRLVRRYLELFGAERVLVLPYELLSAAPEDFATRIVEFAGARPRTKGIRKLRYEERRNEAFSAAAAALLRRWNALFVGDGMTPPALLPAGRVGRRLEGWAREFSDRPRRLDRLVPRALGRASDRRLRELVAEAVGGRYAQSNRRTEELIGADLGALGYDLGPGPDGRAPLRGPGRGGDRVLSSSS